MKKLLSVFCALSATVALAVGTEITNLAWDNSVNGVVSISYQLTGNPSRVTLDIVTADGASVTANGVFTGDTDDILAPGAHHVVWTVTDETFLTTKLYKKGGLYVKAAATNPAAGADYMVIELATGKAAFYANAAAVPSGITDAKYKTTHMAFRRIPAAGQVARLGRGRGETCHASYAATTRPAYLHEFADDYYMAVYEMTIGHYIALGNTYSGVFGQNAYAGKAHNATHQTDWQWHPLESVSTTTADSLSSTLQTRFRAANVLGYVFAVPSEDEWEFACRAGCPRDLPMGTRGYVSSTYGYNNTWIANYQTCEAFYSKQKVKYNDPMPVGRLPANAWGLYDMLGNVAELAVRDGSSYVSRGGGCVMSGENMLASTATATSVNQSFEQGFRLVCRLGE